MGTSQRPGSGFRKCASLPSLVSRDSDSCLEVYCGARKLIELSSKVPERFHGILEDIGVCHYYVIFRQRDGTLTQYDFGPVGGRDISFGGGPRIPLFGHLGANWKQRGSQYGQKAEIRELKVPSHYMLHFKMHYGFH